MKINPCGRCIQMGELDIRVMDGIEELQDQSLSFSV